MRSAAAAPLLLLCAFCAERAYAPLRLNELDLLKRFYNVTGGAGWVRNDNWDEGATSQCGWVDQSTARRCTTSTSPSTPSQATSEPGRATAAASTLLSTPP